MKNIFLFISILLLVFILAACDSTAAAISEQVSSSADAPQENSSPGTEGTAQGAGGEGGSAGQ